MNKIVEFVPKKGLFRLQRIEKEGKHVFVIIDQKIGVFPAGQAYISHISKWRNSSQKTVMASGYIIIEWCNYLRKQKLEWSDADSECYFKWINEQKLTRSRVARKNSVIWRWYKFLSKHPSYQAFARDIFEDISSPTRSDDYGKPRYVPKRAGGEKGSKGDRRKLQKIISDDSVEKLVTRIADLEPTFKNVRDGLMVEFERSCGLRAGGISDIKISSISDALSLVKIIPSYGNILQYSKCRATQAGIRKKLDALSDLGGKGIIIRVTEKNSKTRDVMIPVQLVHQVLDFVWEFSEKWQKTNQKKTLRDASLFMSLKGGRALLPGTVSDVVRNLFNRFGVAGSGHDLRKHRITARALEYVAEAKKHGGLFDGTAIEILLADEFGHNDFSTMKPYVDIARVIDAIGTEAKAAGES